MNKGVIIHFYHNLEKAIELQMDITNYIKPFIKGSCWDLDHHIELAKLSNYTGTNYASFTVLCLQEIYQPGSLRVATQ